MLSWAVFIFEQKGGKGMPPKAVKCPYCGGPAEFAVKDHGVCYFWCSVCQKGVAGNPRGRRGARIPTHSEMKKAVTAPQA